MPTKELKQRNLERDRQRQRLKLKLRNWEKETE